MDNNKTALTHHVTAAAIKYLDGAGFKPIETEVPVDGGWVADVASFVTPSRTEANKLKLVPKIVTPSGGRTVDEWAFKEMTFRHGPMLTALVEVKVTKADFASDLNRKFATRHPPANLCYIAYPTGLLVKEDIPDGWIGLQTTKDGSRVVRVQRGFGWNDLHPIHPGCQADFVAAIAVRRHNRTTDVQRRMRIGMENAKERDRKRTMRINNVVSELVQWLCGEGYYADKTFDELMTLGSINGLNGPAERCARRLEAAKPIIAAALLESRDDSSHASSSLKPGA